MLVTLPAVLLIVDFWPLGRWSRRSAKRLVLEKVPMIVPAGLVAWFTVVAQRSGEAMATLEHYPAGVRLANAVVSYAHYIAKTVWPAELAIYYPHPGLDIEGWKVVSAALSIVTVSVLVVVRRRCQPYLFVGWTWFLVTLVPVIGLVQVGEQAMADRYTYVPSIGLFLMLVWGVADVVARVRSGSGGRVARTAVMLVTVAALLALTAATRIQVGHWRNSITLFEHALEVTESNYIAHFNLGNALLDAGRNDEAVHHLRQAVRIKSWWAEAHYNLGVALGRVGRKRESEQRYRETLRLSPEHAKAHNNLGIALATRGRSEEATRHFTAAIRIDPHFAEALCNLGTALFFADRNTEAIGPFRKALEIDPGYSRARFHLGLALYVAGQHAEGRAELNRATNEGYTAPAGALEVLRERLPETEERR
jgi:Flp pilus assembly protein TadD